MLKSFTKFAKNSYFTPYSNALSNSFASYNKAPARIVLTGAAGQIGYGMAFRIANGDVLGKDQPVILHLIDIPQAKDALSGVAMELADCAFPLLQDVVCTDSLSVGFKDATHAFMVGAKPRSPGMERGDLLKDNGKIFIDQGKAINDNAARNIKVLVVGNPANTNCLILSHYAKDIPKENFTAMTRLDHNRALFQLADKTNTHIDNISNLAIWGNHSPTMYPDLHHCKVNGKPAMDLVDQQWIDKDFIPTVQQRGAAILKARKLSSAASAGNAAIDHIRDWEKGTNGAWTSMGVHSDGSYGIAPGLVFSYPVTIENGKYNIVQGLNISPEAQRRLDITKEELIQERSAIENLLN